MAVTTLALLIIFTFQLLQATVPSQDRVQVFEVPPSCSDRGTCTQEIQSAIASCSSACTVQLDQGVYKVTGKLYSTLFFMSNKHNVNFMGAGSSKTTIIMDDIYYFMQASASSQLTVSGFTVTMSRPPYSYGTAVSTTEIKIDTSLYPVDLARYPWLGTGQALNQYIDNVGYTSFDIYELDGKPISYSADRTTIDVSKFGVPLPVGKQIIVRHQVYVYNTFYFGSINGLTVNDIGIQFTAGMGILAVFCSDVSVTNILINNPGQNYPMSLTADGMHLQDTYGALTVRNCIIIGQGDDGINVVTSMLRITAIGNSKKEITVRGYFPSNVDLKVGDAVNLIDGGDMHWKFWTKITNIQQNTVSLADAIPNSVNVGDLIYDSSAVPTPVIIQNNVFKFNRARGILAKAFNMEISDNTFIGTAGPAILIQADTCTFMEGPPSVNVTIQRNTIYSANFGAGRDNAVITLENLVEQNGKCQVGFPSWILQNIIINNNHYYVQNSLPSIYLGNGNSVQIAGNIFAGNAGKQIQVVESVNVDISGNLCNVSGSTRPCD